MSDGARDAWRVKRSQQQRKYYEANREKIAKKDRKWSQANREKIAEYARKYREANPKKVSEINRKHKQANPEKVKEIRRKWRAKLRTQADADRFFQMMGAAEELTKIIKQRKDEQTEKMGNDE